MQECKDDVIEGKSKVSSSDDRYKTLFERINAAAFLISYEDQILEANQKSYEFLGYEWNELLRLSLKDILSEETDWAQCKDELAARGCLTFECESICKDGTRIPVEVSISIFRLGGKLVMFVLLWDITERKNQEKRLKESEKKYHGLFEYTTDGIIVLDAHGEILDVNTRMCEILDVAKSDFLFKNLFSMDLLTAKSLPAVIQQFEQLLSEKTATSYTTEIKNKHSCVLDVEISSFFLVKKDNEVDNFVLIIRDITARNEAEKKRAQEHELLKTLMDNIPDSVYFKDDRNRFILVNKAKAAHSNVSPAEMIGKTDFDFLPREQAQRIADDDGAIIGSGQAIINKLENIRREDALERWVSVTKIPRFSEEGDIIGTMGVSRDVTEWKRVEEELARNLELLQTLMDAIPDSISFKDAEHRFVLVNKVKAIRWNTYPDAMLGKTDFDFLPPEQAQKSSDDDTKVLKTGNPIINSLGKITGTDGSVQWVSVTKIPRYDRNGRIIGTLCISREVTEQEQYQETKT
jgi:PAS domain S-box-containing protein